MALYVLEKKTEMPCSAERLFSWHETLPYAFNKLLPPNEPVKIIHHDGLLEDGARAIIRVGRGPFHFTWELRHENYIKNMQFCDRQIKGPFRSWYHIHSMIPVTDTTSILQDRVEFEMPFGPIGSLLAKLIVLPKLKALFDFRHQETLNDIRELS